MKILFLPTDVRNQIRDECARCYPEEACGLLLGDRDEGGGYVITDIAPSSNLSAQPRNSFEIDPALIIQHQKKSRANGRQIIGHYHSHPDGQAAPSRHDQDQNYDSDLIWVIVEVQNKAVNLINAFATDPRSGQLTAIPLKLAQPEERA